MRVFGRLESSFWDNPKVRELTDHEKLLLIYLFSCKHGNAIGCFVLPMSTLQQISAGLPKQPLSALRLLPTTNS